MSKKLILYFDDTGTRDPDKKAFSTKDRKDNMDCFGLGGILVKEEDVDRFVQLHDHFCSAWNVDYPLHSSDIRGARNKFGWLRKPMNAYEFMTELDSLIVSLPFVANACVIDRKGYIERYKEQHKDRLWMMCKTAFSILIERSAKYADSQGRKLEVIFEQSGKKEDRDIEAYARFLKQNGMPFSADTSNTYVPLTTEDFNRIVLGKPMRKTKKVPMLQIADLVLYPIAKAAYDPKNKPYLSLKKNKKLLDCHLDKEDIPELGIKYSCFGVQKTKGPK